MEKKRVISIIAIVMAVVIIVIALAVTMIYTVGSELGEYIAYPIDMERYKPYKIMSDTEIAEDVNELIKLTESTHARYYLYGDRQDYLVQKTNLLKLKSMRAVDFAIECARYLSSFYDYNTKVDATQDGSSGVLDFRPNWYFDTNKGIVYLADDTDGMPRGARLTSIGGVSYDTLLARHNLLQGIENRATQAMFIWSILFWDYLEAFKCAINDGKVEVEFTSAEGISYRRSYGLITYNEYVIKYRINQKKDNYEVTRESNKMVITVRNFEHDSSFEPAIAEINDAIMSGVQDVTIDLRGNRRGDKKCSDGLMNGLGIVHSRMENNVRLSAQTKKYFGTARFTGMAKTSYKYQSVNKNNLKLRVLTNEYTYGNALRLAASLKNSGLATIVGRASGQSPNYCSDMFYSQLTNSGIVFSMTVSYGRLYTKSGAEIGNVLEPDQYVDWQGEQSGFFNNK